MKKSPRPLFFAKEEGRAPGLHSEVIAPNDLPCRDESVPFSSKEFAMLTAA